MELEFPDPSTWRLVSEPVDVEFVADSELVALLFGQVISNALQNASLRRSLATYSHDQRRAA